MANYKTPGVYVEEISTLPPSVGQVPTAVPAFVGYTQKAIKSGASVKNQAIHITSMLDYVDYFGGGYIPQEINVGLNASLQVESVALDKQFFMYDSVRLFFANGGGECYIVSVGNYDDDIEFESLQSGMDAVKRENQPTILASPDAVLLSKSDECYSLQQQMLMQCAEMQNRFAVLDVYDGYISRKEEDVVLNFRNGVGVNNLKYGASYYPWVFNSLPHKYNHETIKIKVGDDEKRLEEICSHPISVKNLNMSVTDFARVQEFSKEKDYKSGLTDLLDNMNGDDPNYEGAAKYLGDEMKALYDFATSFFNSTAVSNEMGVKVNASSKFAALLKDYASFDAAVGSGGFAADQYATLDLGEPIAMASIADAEGDDIKNKLIKENSYRLGAELRSIMDSILEDAESIKINLGKIAYDYNPLLQNIVNEIYKELSKITPSGAIAGVYAMVDNQRGVWKAPANVSLSAVSRPIIKIDDNQQEDLNVDVISGKSVNAIRSFTGKGTLVWGARTLSGNDNEWRYVPVRRFFNMVEDSVRNATGWAVFEPNDASTWIRVKAMIENYLTNLWKAGALAGAAADQAFFVNIGLGTTMSSVDILEGRMNVEIGMAVVRPAEFVVLKFSHKLQES
jgi:phage tail sheath protein FI